MRTYPFKHKCIPLHHIRVEIIINNGLIESETKFIPVNRIVCSASISRFVAAYIVHILWNSCSARLWYMCHRILNNRMSLLQVPFHKYGNEANKFYTVIIIIVPKIYLMSSGIHESPVSSTARYQLQYLFVFCASIQSLYSCFVFSVWSG